MWCWRQQRFHHWTMDLGNQPLMQWQHLCSGIWTSRIVMTCLSQPYHGNLLQIFECNLASWIIIHNDSFLKMCFLILYHSASMTHDYWWSFMITHHHSWSFVIHDCSWLRTFKMPLVLSRSMHHGADIARSCLVKRMVSLWFQSGEVLKNLLTIFGRWCIEESFVTVDSVDGIAAYSPGFHIK